MTSAKNINTKLNFKDWLMVNGYAPNSILSYIPRIEVFLNYIGNNKITETTVNNFLLYMQGKYDKASTVNGYRNAIKTYLVFSKKDIAVPKNLKLIKTMPKIITPEFFEEKIIPAVDHICMNPKRIKAFLYCMFYTGIRLSESVILKRENFDFENNTVKIYVGKTKEERMTIFPEGVGKIIKMYFMGEAERENAFNIGKRDNVKRIFKDIDNRIEDVHIHPHLFRHSIATYLLDLGIDVTLISQFLGHKSIQTTMRYLHVTPKMLFKEYRAKVKIGGMKNDSAI